MMILGVVVGVVFAAYGLICFLRALFAWDSYSQHPESFPLGKRGALQIDMYGWLYDVYGDKAVRKGVFVSSLVIVVLGIWLAAAFVSNNVESRKVESYSRVSLGEAVSIAGGELLLEGLETTEQFTVNSLNVDTGEYEEAEVRVEARSKDVMLLLTGTFTNNSGSTLTISQRDIRFYARPTEEGNKITGEWLVDGHGDMSGNVELAVGESVSVSFWLTLSKENQKKDFTLILQSGEIGYRIGR